MDEYEARAILGVSESADFSEIKKSYRSLVKAMHPDMAPKDAASQERATTAMGRLNEAWELIQMSEKAGTLGSSGFENRSDFNFDTGSSFDVRPRATLNDECEICGSWPAIPLILSTVSTFWIFLSRTNYEGSLCRSCGLAMSRFYLKESLVKGWWGLGALFMPLVIFRAVHSERQLLDLGDPTYRDALVITPQELPMLVDSHPAKQPLPLLASALALAIVGWFFLSDSSSTSNTPTSNPSGSTSSNSAYADYERGKCFLMITGSVENTVSPISCDSGDADAISLGIVANEAMCPASYQYTVFLSQGKIACLADR